MQDWRTRYQRDHENWFKQEYPNCYKDGHYIEPKYPDVKTSNGLQSAIIEHLKFTGNYGNRINVMGRVVGGITVTESGARFNDKKWIKSSTKKGTEDIDAILFSKPVKFEVKIGKDTQGKNQIKHQAKIEKAGGKYFIVKTIEDYFNIFDQLNPTTTIPAESTILNNAGNITNNMKPSIFKVIIAGGRDFNDYALLRTTMDKLLANKLRDNIIIEIVSGCQRTVIPRNGQDEICGADYLGECYASERGFCLRRFPADWKQWGLRAGPLRNKEMAAYADACVCFWDGKSRGTSWMIKFAQQAGIMLRVVRYEAKKQSID